MSLQQVANKHMKRICTDTLKMPDAMVGVMGGPSKAEAMQWLLSNGYGYVVAQLRRKGYLGSVGGT